MSMATTIDYNDAKDLLVLPPRLVRIACTMYITYIIISSCSNILMMMSIIIILIFNISMITFMVMIIIDNRARVNLCALWKDQLWVSLYLLIQLTMCESARTPGDSITVVNALA